jgi:hypothetical protein
MSAFGEPGWSHEGSSMSIKQLRKALKEEKKKAQMINGKTDNKISHQKRKVSEVLSETG